jgi:hypothetical protein
VSVDPDLWWDQLRAASLVGTARREVPETPDLGATARPDASRETSLLDAAALGDAVRRAGRLADVADEPDDPAPAESLEVAPSPAVQILELLLNQGPVSAAARVALTAHWLDTAAAARRIVPPRLLPVLLDAATPQSPVRRGVRPVLGERGRWLAARNPAWDWATVPVEEGPTTAASVRAHVEATWDTSTAQGRASAVAALVVGLGPDDEPFLERCLDDRARAVREEAQRLLDRLPGSARAQRMADRLRPLVRVTGTLRKQVEVLLPGEPDAAGIRDGLTEPAPGGSRRVRWMQQVVAATPLPVWTELTRVDPRKLLGMFRAPDDIVPALREAAVSQRDATWARALLPLQWDSRLLAVLDGPERDAVLAAKVQQTPLPVLAQQLIHVEPPWGPRASAELVQVLVRSPDGHALRVLRSALPLALHPDSLPAVERAMHAAGDDAYLRTTLRDVLQYQSIHTAISEALR